MACSTAAMFPVLWKNCSGRRRSESCIVGFSPHIGIPPSESLPRISSAIACVGAGCQKRTDKLGLILSEQCLEALGRCTRWAGCDLCRGDLFRCHHGRSTISRSRSEGQPASSREPGDRIICPDGAAAVGASTIFSWRFTGHSEDRNRADANQPPAGIASCGASCGRHHRLLDHHGLCGCPKASHVSFPRVRPGHFRSVDLERSQRPRSA